MRLLADTGWGFTDCGFGQKEAVPLGPEQKREHLFAFWKTKVWLLLFQTARLALLLRGLTLVYNCDLASSD